MWNDSDDGDMFLTQADMDINLSDVELSQAAEEIESKYPQFEDILDDEDQALAAATVDIQTVGIEASISSRFSRPKTEMTSLGRRRLAESTMNKMKWAKTLFSDWAKNRNAVNRQSVSARWINPQLEFIEVCDMNYILSRFVTEVRKTDGGEYPGNTLHDIITSLQLHLEMCGIHLKLLCDPDFSELKNTLDATMRERASMGLGTAKRQAAVITEEEEETMWRKNILGSDSPQQLQETLLYLIGLNFALRAAKEHRALRLKNSQLKLLYDSRGKRFLRYTEDVSKVHHGGIKHRKQKPKSVDAYANETNPTRCVVTLYEKYVSLCPPGAQEFYLRALPKPQPGRWFGLSPVGVHKLSTTVQRLTEAAGLDGFRSNHSLRATAATRLYRCNVDEQLIRETTGHRSDAVQEYKRTCESQKETVSRIVQGCRRRQSTPASATRSTHGSGTNRITDGCLITLNCNVRVTPRL